MSRDLDSEKKNGFTRPEVSAEGCSADGCHKTVSRRGSRDEFSPSSDKNPTDFMRTAATT